MVSGFFPNFASMKAWCFFLGWFVLLALTACHNPHREARRMIHRAELLLDSLPDSSANLIDSALRMPITHTERQRMNMSLLYTLTLYKGPETDLDYAAEHTPPDLPDAAAYFARKKDYDKAGKASLYTGYMLYQTGQEASIAAKYLKDAEYYGTLAHDTLLVAKAQLRLACLILEHDQTLGEDLTSQEGIALLEKAVAGYKRDDYYRLSKAYSVKTLLHVKMQELDKAEESARKNLEYAEKAHSVICKNEALHDYALIYRQQGKLEQSIDCIRMCLASGDTIALPDYLYQIATSFYADGQQDSAQYYFDRLNNVLISLDGTDKAIPFRRKCYDILSHFAEEMGNNAQALYYVRKHEDLYYKQIAKDAEKNIYRIQKQYDYNTLQHETNLRIAKNQYVIALLTLIVTSLLAAFALSQLRLARKKKQEMETQAKLFHYMLNNKDLKQKYEGNEQAARNYAKMLSEAWTKEEMTMLKLAIFLKGKADKASLDELKHTVFGKEDSWEAMMGVVDKIYPGFRETIRQKYPDLSDNEQKDFLLSYFNVSRQDEAALLGVSVSVVDKLRNKTRKKTAQSSNFSEKSSD